MRNWWGEAGRPEAGRGLKSAHSACEGAAGEDGREGGDVKYFLKRGLSVAWDFAVAPAPPSTLHPEVVVFLSSPGSSPLPLGPPPHRPPPGLCEEAPLLSHMTLPFTLACSASLLLLHLRSSYSPFKTPVKYPLLWKVPPTTYPPFPDTHYPS